MQAPGGGGGKGTSRCKLFELIVNFTYYSTCLLVKMCLIMQTIHDYYGVTIIVSDWSPLDGLFLVMQVLVKNENSTP